MTGFSLDFNDTFDGSVKDGTYEAVIKKVQEKTANTGTKYINFELVIRNDVQQAHQNQYIFDKAWENKETGKFNRRALNTIGKAAQLQNGKVYNSLDDLLNDYVGKPVRVTVKNETSEYNGKTYENLNIKNWDVTKINGPVRHVFKDKDKQTVAEGISNGVIVNDDDLPF